MITVSPFQQAPFDAATIQVMRQALDHACMVLGVFGRSEPFHEVMAKRIIEVAKAGERDPRFLCEQALRAFSAQKLSEQAVARADAPGAIPTSPPRPPAWLSIS